MCYIVDIVILNLYAECQIVHVMPCRILQNILLDIIIALFTVTNMATNYVLMLIYLPFGQKYFMDSQTVSWRIKYIFKTLKTHAVYQSMCNSYNILSSM